MLYNFLYKLEALCIILQYSLRYPLNNYDVLTKGKPKLHVLVLY